MTRLDQKLARIRAGRYTPADFIIADAKDGDMGPACTLERAGARARRHCEPLRDARRVPATRSQAIVAQDLVDIMLISASNLERLHERRRLRRQRREAGHPRQRHDRHLVGARRPLHQQPSRPFRTGVAQAPGCAKLTDLGLYSITFNNDLDADLRSLEAFTAFRADAPANGFRYFLEVFNPNVDIGPRRPDVAAALRQRQHRPLPRRR